MDKPRLAKSPWSDVVGPFYAEPGLLRRGLDPDGDSDPESQLAVRALAHVREWVHRLGE